MKKIISFIMSLFLIVSIISCKPTENDPVEITLNTPTNVLVSNTGLITWDSVEYATKYIIKINDETYESSVNSYQVTDLTKDFICTVIAAADGYKQSAQSDPVTFKSPIIDPDPPKPPVSNIKVGISGSTEVKTEKSITLKATVEGTVIKTDRAKKIIVYKQRPKKGYRRKQGHRQGFCRVMINKIRTTAQKSKAAEASESAEA